MRLDEPQRQRRDGGLSRARRARRCGSRAARASSTARSWRLDAAGRPDFGLLQERMNLVKPGEIEAAQEAEARAPVPVRRARARRRGPHRARPTRPGATQLAKVIDAPRGSPIARAATPSTATPRARSSSAGTSDSRASSPRRPARTYEEGRRSGVWIKIKHLARRRSSSAAGARARAAAPAPSAPCCSGSRRTEGLRYVGRVGTGLRDRDLERLVKRLEPLAQDETPFIAVPREDCRRRPLGDAVARRRGGVRRVDARRAACGIRPGAASVPTRIRTTSSGSESAGAPALTHARPRPFDSSDVRTARPAGRCRRPPRRTPP